MSEDLRGELEKLRKENQETQSFYVKGSPAQG